jgi:hypothetical protein
MNDQWIPSPPQPPPTWTPNPLPPSNEWSDTEACAAPSGPSIVDGIVITGVPATVSSLYWQVSLNDGSSPPNFQINHLDGKGAVLDAALQISGADLSATFAGPVYLARDPVEPMEAVTLEYLEAHGAGVEEAPSDGQTYGRTSGAWNVVVPASGGTFSGPTNLGAGGAVTSGALLFAGNAVCSLPTVAQLEIGGGSAGQVPATDGNGNLSWVTPVTGGPYLPLSGGTVTGSLTVNQVLTVQGSNSLVLNAPVTGGNQRAILSMAANVTRWQLALGDGTAEGANNAGANFNLSAYSTTGGFLGNWLTIARADGSTVFNGTGITVNGGLAVNGLFAVNSLGNFYLPGGSAGQVLTTNGSGLLSWTTPAAGGSTVTISDTAPASPTVGALWWDSVGGQMYLRYQDPNTIQWVPTTNAASLPPPASTTVLGSVKVDGTSIKAAADGTISTVLIPMGDNRLINGDMRIDQRNNGASGAANNVYTIDRWFYGATQASKGNWARNSSGSGVPGPAGFPYCLGFASSSAYASLATDNFYFQQRIEADMISDFAWGTSGAQPVTLSFWVYSSLTGTFSGCLENGAANRGYPFSFSIPVANTWTRIVVIIPGDTGGTWTLSGNGVGLYAIFDLGSGANFRAPAGAWATGNYVGATGAVSVVATNGATFYLTGVKLEIGSVATPYNRQSLAKCLADCQRYYQVLASMQLGGNSQVTGPITTAAIPLSPQMRAQPTVTTSNLSYGNASALTLAPSSSNVVQTFLSVTAVGAWNANFNMLSSAEL